MTRPQIDYGKLFQATPTACVILGPDLVILDANQAYLRATGRTRQELLGRYLFDAFPQNPADPGADDLKTSLQRVLDRREEDAMALQKYDLPVPGRPGVFEEHWWTLISSPVAAPDGSVGWIIHRVEDVTAFVEARRSGRGPGQAGSHEEELEAELFARARDLQRLNEELRQAHGRERQVALALQQSMLHCPDLARHPRVAVRYLPATELNVCGDWYDLVDLPEGCLAVAVGDVVGHGLQAAAVMGMLRSSLGTAMRAIHSPAQALEALDLYACSVEDALGTTAVNVLVDPRNARLTYSSAGHLPPVLLRPDGTCDLLDQATAPPLGARTERVPFPEATLAGEPGQTLVLYTDGLVERRGEDIDTGVRRLTEALSRHRHLGVERLADALLGDLTLSDGPCDDVALLIARL